MYIIVSHGCSCGFHLAERFVTGGIHSLTNFWGSSIPAGFFLPYHKENRPANQKSGQASCPDAGRVSTEPVFNLDFTIRFIIEEKLIIKPFLRS